MSEKWADCKTIFSNGTEFELFTEQCYKCTKYRNGKCRIYNRILDAMWVKERFPFSDLMDATGGYGGKKCKSYTIETPKRNRVAKEIEGQISIDQLRREYGNKD